MNAMDTRGSTDRPASAHRWRILFLLVTLGACERSAVGVDRAPRLSLSVSSETFVAGRSVDLHAFYVRDASPVTIARTTREITAGVQSIELVLDLRSCISDAGASNTRCSVLLDAQLRDPAGVPVDSVRIGPIDVSTVTVIERSVTLRGVSRVTVAAAGALFIGDTTRARATLSDGAGAALVGRRVTWSSTNTAVATVDTGGLITAIASGTTDVVAEAEGVSASAPVVVTAIGAGLVHRWTFSETGGSGTTLVDDVGGANGSIVEQGPNDATVGNGRVVLTGGAVESSDYVALPSGLLSGLTNASIEVWASQIAVQRWSRIFDFGSSDRNNLLMSWSIDVDINRDRVEWRAAPLTLSTLDGTLSPYTLGSEFQIVMTIEANAGVGGQTRVRVYRNGVARGVLDTPLRLGQLEDVNAWLGRSNYPADATANASFNDVRIYNRALTTTEVAARFLQGPR
jgi:hypothetical protein